MTSPPENCAPESKIFLPAPFCYKLTGGKLTIDKKKPELLGGAMIIDAQGLTGVNISSITDEILAEVFRQKATATVVNSGNANQNAVAALVAEITAKMPEIRIFLPDTQMNAGLFRNTPSVSLLVQSAISGGSLSDSLERSVRLFGQNRIGLETDRISIDFVVPSADFAGASVPVARLPKDRTVHFSEELAVNYLCTNDDGDRHFILFDDVASLMYKIRLAESFGVSHIFMFYPHVSDIYEELEAELLALYGSAFS
jgi:hypothetical protein